MKKLWQKDWDLNVTVEAFETKGDLTMDQKLIAYDIYGSLAHIAMLKAIGILTTKEHQSLKKGLTGILNGYKKGKVNLQFGDEDMHTKIESILTEKIGDSAKKIHTGRSRNDQIATDLALYEKHQLLTISESTVALAHRFIALAKLYEFLPMPGYTHMQKAMPSSVGMWAASFVESLLCDLASLKSAYEWTDASPLGSGAGYGVPLKLDRALTAKLLGFGHIRTVSLSSQNTRGKQEAAIVAALIGVLLTINKFASDVLLFTTSEFGFFTVSDSLTTGSSIMPQKKNIDVAELLRSKVHIALGNYTTIVSLVANLPSGYNRDYQDLKAPLMATIELTLSCLDVAIVLLENLTLNTDKLARAMTPELFAAHVAFQKTSKGVPFRDAYHEAARELGTLKALSKAELTKGLLASVHIGGTGNLGLGILEKRLKQEANGWKKASSAFQGALGALKGGDTHEIKNTVS